MALASKECSSCNLSQGSTCNSYTAHAMLLQNSVYCVQSGSRSQKRAHSWEITSAQRRGTGFALGMLPVKERPTANRTAEARPAAAGPEADRSKRSALLAIRLRMRYSAPKEPIWPLGTNRDGPSLICGENMRTL